MKLRMVHYIFITIFTLTILFINFTNIFIVEGYSSVEHQINIIEIQDNSILWIYSDTVNQLNVYRNIVVVSTPLSVEFKIEMNTDFNKTQPAIINFSYVFIGGERLFYQFTYKTTNISISIDSNIVISKDYITIQWYNIKTRIQAHFANSSLKYAQVDEYIEEAIEKLNLSMIKNFNVFMTITQVRNEVVESISIYDLYINESDYLKYLNLGSHTCDFKLNELPMYALLEINEITNINMYASRYRIEGIDVDDINLALDSLQCLIPAISIVNNIIKNCRLNTLFTEISAKIDIDAVRKTNNVSKEYIDKGIEAFMPLIHNIKNNYKISKPVVEVKYVLDGLKRQRQFMISLNSTNILNINEYDVRRILTNASKVYEIIFNNNSTSILSSFIDNAQIIDLRKSTSDSETKNVTTSSNLILLLIVAVTLIATTIQTAVVIITILKIFRSQTT